MTFLISAKIQDGSHRGAPATDCVEVLGDHQRNIRVGHVVFQNETKIFQGKLLQ